MTLDIKLRAENNILGTYKRFPIHFTHGKGVYLYDNHKNEYLDLAGGIAVNSLGHAHPEIVETLHTQASKLMHVSNLFYTEEQIKLSEKINQHIALPGKVFLCNSGAEANECVIKLARKFGAAHNKKTIVTAVNSFHGRTFGGMSATGQDKIKAGFEPLLSDFKHIPYNCLTSLEKNLTADVAAFIIEGIQGESGIVPATKEYLIKARELCTKHNILLCIDAVQCGFFRTGSYQSYSSILEELKDQFKPDAVAQAKAMGGGFPVGATWISDEFKDVLRFGNHGSTYGGNPLACAVSTKIFEIIERDNLQTHIKSTGAYFLTQLKALKIKYPKAIKDVRGLGLMIGIELENIPIPEKYKDLSIASYATLKALQDINVIFVPAGTSVLRILPAYTIQEKHINLGLEKFEHLLKQL